jgi:hypothetical protein
MFLFIGSRFFNGDIAMPDFDAFALRHGEAGAQALIENIERHSRVRVQLDKPLERRWYEAMSRAGNDDKAGAQ